MSSNGPIPPNMNPTSSGASAFEPEQAGVRHSLHHCYIWLDALRVAPIIFICGLSSLPGLAKLAEVLGFVSVDAFFAAVLLLLAATVLICGVVTGVRAWTYRYTWYEFDETEFSFYSGILNKRRTHVPYSKIQSVNERASLLQRLAGVCTVNVDTAGGANNKALVISYVERSAAEYLRRELFRRKSIEGEGERVVTAAQGAFAEQGNVLDGAAAVMDDMRGIFAKDAVDTGVVACEYRLGNKELLLSALCGRASFGLALAIAMVALIVVATLVILAVLVDSSTFFAATGALKSDLMLACGLTGVLLLFCLAMTWVAYLVGVCLSYGGFQARRRGSRIEVERGLITHMFSGIDVDRIQSVHIHQTFFQRLMHCCSVSYGRVGVASGEESSGSSSQPETDKLVVHPFLPIGEAWNVVQSLTPEYAHAPVASTPMPKVALRRAITRRAVLKGVGFWLAMGLLLLCAASFAADATAVRGHARFGGLAVATLMPGLLLCVAIATIEVVGAFLWHRRSAFGFDSSGTIVVNGGYSTDMVIVPRRKMQYACLRTNPLQRHAGVATVLVRTAAGVRGCDERLIDVPIAEASDWLDWAQPKGNRAV